MFASHARNKLSNVVTVWANNKISSAYNITYNSHFANTKVVYLTVTFTFTYGSSCFTRVVEAAQRRGRFSLVPMSTPSNHIKFISGNVAHITKNTTLHYTKKRTAEEWHTYRHKTKSILCTSVKWQKSWKHLSGSCESKLHEVCSHYWVSNHHTA